jgi:hypothetical protein
MVLHQLSAKVLLFQHDTSDQRKRVISSQAIARRPTFGRCPLRHSRPAEAGRLIVRQAMDAAFRVVRPVTVVPMLTPARRVVRGDANEFDQAFRGSNATSLRHGTA